ncbi:MAG: VWA domain-containing protein [Acidobacteria bacterium]|nr:VWA domain-containing protein [Acidobacteriota bacterium]MCW5971176.1 VWA domain-containing protein [Blastocatellales bacterium]
MKRRALSSVIAALVLLSNLVIPAGAQSGRRSPPEPERREIGRPDQDPPRPRQPEQAPEEAGEDGTIKIDTTLVTIPLTVLDRDGKYVPNLQKRDFQLYEDGVEQEIAEFISVEAPFHVVLLIDTSRSTVFQIEDIQRSAISFVDQLRRDDRVMVVSFDDKIYVDSEFTSDRTRLRRAIYGTRTGGSTKLYDAVDLVITERLNAIDGRKAIVLFTDGVDTTSRFAKAASTLELVEESDILVYPIRYDTETQMNGPVFGGGGGRGGTGPIIDLPLPRGRTRRWPLTGNMQWTPQSAFPQWPRTGGGGRADYRKGAQYLQDLADRSGARLYDANTLRNLDEAFSLIAEELRHQYALSYYPTNAARDGAFRKIRVRARQQNLVVRTREGYRAAGESAQADRGETGNGRPRLARPRP